MKTEKVVISFFAVIIGIIVSAIAFYLYQTTKVIPVKQKEIALISPSPKKEAIEKAKTIFLTLDQPKEEIVVTSKIVKIAGKTIPTATIIILTKNIDQVIKPANNGNFSTTIDIDDFENYLEILAVSPNGEEVKETRTITYSTENF